MLTRLQMWAWLAVLGVVISVRGQAQTVAFYGGTVKNTDNQPIENVLVAAQGAPSVLSGFDGAFQLAFDSLPTFRDSVPGGDTIYAPVSISFTHPDFQTGYRVVVLHPGDSVFGQVITLDPPLQDRSISGHIADELNQPIANAHVVCYRIDNPVGWGETFDAYTDANGNYQVNATTGQYYVQAIAYWGTGPTQKHKQKWYDNVDLFADASILTVDNDVTGIDFSFTTPVACTISGTVIDQVSQQPVPDALVFVYSTTWYDSSYHVTDQDGHYTIDLYDGEYTVQCAKEPYVPLYYNQVLNFYEATPVVVSAETPDVTGIDFQLYPRPGGTNSIEGTVTDETTGLPLNDVEVIALPMVQGAARPGTSRATDKTDNNGDYTMTGLGNGTYYLLFVRTQYAGEFYGNTQLWENAAVITLSGNTHLTDVNAGLMPLPVFGALVTGAVSSTSQALTGGVPGTLISAFDGQDVLVSSGLSGYGGAYELPCLPNGSYILKASVVGYQSQQYGQAIPVDLNNATVINGVDFALSPQVVDVGGGKPDTFVLDQNSPNPFNPTTTIRFVLPAQGRVTLAVYNLLGQRVRTLMNKVQSAGAAEVIWDGRNDQNQSAASGVYFYKLVYGNQVLVRKMTLMK